ncbi:hypothetical protein [Streptomyces showdoensis]|uniref:Uncharacterized protein n=1 Tax=Streptomyces showdoensis TaxID=68268 RepID=A0A2P2GJI9_STREW|nr:hypothetical protein [Streptomyces showdoensis]KKZ71657.1 hypothetical protein VO63_22725 [Streptomyces showdoensis]
MSYRLDAVVGDFDRLRTWAGGVPGAVVAPLRQRLGLLPLSDALCEDLPRLLRELSRTGPVAHVAADFWGGDGEQTAALWRAGAQEWGPAHTEDFSGPREGWPINAVLARLGAEPAAPGAPEYRDLFAEVGLGGGRHEEDWRRAALEARDAADYDEWYERERAARESEERAAAERAVLERLRGVPVPLDGKAIMTLLGMPEGRTIGAALRHLRQLRIDRGPQTREEAESALRAWAAEQGLPSVPVGRAGEPSP